MLLRVWYIEMTSLFLKLNELLQSLFPHMIEPSHNLEMQRILDVFVLTTFSVRDAPKLLIRFRIPKIVPEIDNVFRARRSQTSDSFSHTPKIVQ